MIILFINLMAILLMVAGITKAGKKHLVAYATFVINYICYDMSWICNHGYSDLTCTVGKQCKHKFAQKGSEENGMIVFRSDFTDGNACDLEFCNTVGTLRCVNTDGSYECVCNEGYSGVNCTTRKQHTYTYER